MLTLTSVPLDHPLLAQARFNDAKWLHQRVMDLFGDLGQDTDARQRGRILFRYEPWVGDGRILVQSTSPPVVDGVRTTALTPVLAQIEAGQRVRFLLHANAVRTVNRTDDDGSTRTHRADVPPDQRLHWLQQRLQGALDGVDAADPPVTSFRLGRNAKLMSVNFTGTATVTDPQQLAVKVRDGIGRGKAFGCGLLTVAPTR